MGVINDTHDTPHVISSSGYMPLLLMHEHTGPALMQGAAESRPERRAKAKAMVRARKAEQSSGAGFLSLLTTTRHSEAGSGINQGEYAPSRRNMGAYIQ